MEPSSSFWREKDERHKEKKDERDGKDIIKGNRERKKNAERH